MDKLFPTNVNHLSKTLLIFIFLLSMVGVFAQETISIDAKATYFGVEKLDRKLVSLDSNNDGKWWLRSAINMTAYGEFVLHPPEVAIQDIEGDPALKGTYDIYVGMREVDRPTGIQFKLSGMTDYYTVVVPASTNKDLHFPVEIPVVSNVKMDAVKIIIHNCGMFAYLGYFKFVKSGETPFTPSSSVSIKPAVFEK